MQFAYSFSLAALAGIGSMAGATDLDRIVPPAKEPTYKTSPRYCQLAFGPSAATHVWIVIDGDTVFIDTNGDGDLTGTRKKFALSKPKPSGWPQYFAEERYVSGVTITDGTLKHTDLHIYQERIKPDPEVKTEGDRQLKQLVEADANALVYVVRVSVHMRELPGGKIKFSGRLRQDAGQDAQGFLQFAKSPRAAPVIHFGGPLRMALQARQMLAQGPELANLYTVIGTPGRGSGTFAAYVYDGLFGEDTHPVADIEFPTAGKDQLRARVPLRSRC